MKRPSQTLEQCRQLWLPRCTDALPLVDRMPEHARPIDVQYDGYPTGFHAQLVGGWPRLTCVAVELLAAQNVRVDGDRICIEFENVQAVYRMTGVNLPYRCVIAELVGES